MKTQNKNRASLYLKTIAFIKPFKLLLVYSVILNLLFSLFNTLSVALIKPVFQILFKTDSSETVAKTQNLSFLEQIKNQFFDFLLSLIIVDDIYWTLVRFGLIILLVFFLKNFFKYWNAVVMSKFEEGVIKSIRDKIFSKLTSLSIDFFNRSKQGSLISIIANDVQAVNSTMIASFSIILREGSQVVFFLLFLLSISPELTLIAFSSSIFSLGIVRAAKKYLRKYATRMQKALADYTGTLTEIISGIRVVKAYNAENFANEKFKKDSERYVKSAVKHKMIVTIIPAINEIFAIFALTVVLVVGAMKINQKVMSPDDLMLFLFTLFSIMAPLASVINQIVQFPRGFVSAERIFEVLDTEPSVKDGNLEIKEFRDKIEVKNVYFAYTDKNVLEDVSLVIPKGKKTAFVGGSGSGKSTMVDLLIRFYDPQKGQILIDGVDIRNYKVSSLRSLFGVVSQENMLFNDTVANNIKFGKEHTITEEIVEASKLANAYNFIDKLELGFDTPIGDRGTNLSGGERQRVAVARAIVGNPQILIFDEATSALDAESEKIVQEAIETSLEGRTAIIVAHRLSTIINCDMIYVFNEGRIVEQGTHQELMEKNGYYRKLCELQFGVKN
ncbi:MAG: ABC transporter ATP-binding protein/permease [Ignavibacteria bacterium]|nr:ABC transporter ATP-binding protein/permease [Ignavibacteria bacterium]